MRYSLLRGGWTGHVDSKIQAKAHSKTVSFKHCYHCYCSSIPSSCPLLLMLSRGQNNPAGLFACKTCKPVAPEKYFFLISSWPCNWPCLGAVHTTFLPTVDSEDQRWKSLWESLNPVLFYTRRVWNPERGNNLLKATQLMSGRELCLLISSSGLS